MGDDAAVYAQASASLFFAALFLFSSNEMALLPRRLAR